MVERAGVADDARDEVADALRGGDGEGDVAGSFEVVAEIGVGVAGVAGREGEDELKVKDVGKS